MKRAKCFLVGLLACLFVGVFILVASAYFFVRLGRERIRQQTHWGSEIQLRFQSIHLSWAYYLYVTYEIEGEPELSRVYWRLKGNEVVEEM